METKVGAGQDGSAGTADPLRGVLLRDRYRILGRLSRGETATVYQARDERLDRPVTVKIVHPEYVLDPVVLDRLGHEAMTVARLGHPNMVSVYDQGTHEGAPFLVMEHVRGRTLREVLADRGRLDPAESLAVVEQLLAALAVAHRAGLVHGDVRPETILVSPPPNGSGDLVDAVVKVNDFGMAHAVEIGRSTGRVLEGSRYVAPELITNGRADARADVYSAGIVLFEMLTGQVPFASDDTGQAFRHVDDDVPVPSQVARDVPGLLDGIVARATRRDPRGRPRDAGALLAEIQTAREDVGALAGPTRALAHPTVIVPSVDDRPTRPDWARLPGQRPAAGRPGRATVVAQPGRAGQHGSGNRLMEPVKRVGDWAHLTANRLRYTAKGRRILFALIVVLGLLLITGGWYVGFGRYTQAPDLTALTKSNAIAEANRLGFSVEIGAGLYNETVPVDTVLAQEPRAGGRIVKGGTVTLHLSLGPERYEMPNLVGKDFAFAVTQLPKQVTYEKIEGYSDTLPVGFVAGTDPPAGSALRPNQTVQIYVVKGPFPVHVPSVVGRTLEQATSQLKAAGFTDIEVETRESDLPKDTVLEQSPEANTGMESAQGQKITLVVSTGPAQTMPNLVGKNCGNAFDEIKALGVNPSVSPALPLDAWRLLTVAAQDVPEGQVLVPNQSVHLSCGP